jgi:hypothetical protein
MNKGDLAIDPRGLIFESYRMDGIRIEECRSIFLDWALGQAIDVDMQAALKELEAEYVAANPDHPMNDVIAEGLKRSNVASGRRGGRKSKVDARTP